MAQSRRQLLRRIGATAAAGFGTAAATSGTAAASHFALGEAVHTTTALNVRDGPGTSNAVIDTEPARMRGQTMAGPEFADGFEWWLVEFDDDRVEDGATGWCAVGDGWLQSGKDRAGWKFVRYDGVHTTTALHVRDAPGTDATVVDTAAQGATGQIIGGPQTADGFTWWHVDYHDHATGWSADDGWLVEGTLAACGPWETDTNVFALGKVLTSEAGRFIASDAARRAVAFSVLNRMDRIGTDQVTDVWDAYAHSRDPSAESRALARDVLSCSVADNSAGATHFYSPVSMPKEGEDTSGFDVGGGLEWSRGLSERNYRPSWGANLPRCYVPGAAPENYKFFRLPGNDF